MENTTSKNPLTTKVLNQYDVFAERAKKINSLILETGSEELENQFGELMSDVTILIKGITDKNRQEWLNHGFELDTNENTIATATGMGNTFHASVNRS